MGGFRHRGAHCQTKQHQHVKDGTLGQHATNAPGVAEAKRPPAGTRVRFSRRAGKTVFRQYVDGKPTKAALLFSPKGKAKNYYEEGDFLAEGEFDARTLQKMFPDAGITAKKFTFGDVLSSLAGMYEQEKFPLVRRLDKITGDPQSPWNGTVQTSYYLVVEKQFIPIVGAQSRQNMVAQDGNGSLNNHFIWAPTMQQMAFLQTVIESEAKIISELARSAGIGAAAKAAKGMKIVQKLAKSKLVKGVGKVLEHVDKDKLLRACKAFAAAFITDLTPQLTKYTLQQFASKETKIKLAADVATTNVSFEGAAIGPSSVTASDNAYVSMSKAPEVNVGTALVKACMAFAHSLLVTDVVAEPLAKAAAKKLDVGTIKKAAADYLKGVLDGVLTDLTSGAFATAATKAAQDPEGKASFLKHCRAEITAKLLSRCTTDLVKGVLSAAAGGFGD